MAETTPDYWGYVLSSGAWVVNHPLKGKHVIRDTNRWHKPVSSFGFHALLGRVIFDAFHDGDPEKTNLHAAYAIDFIKRNAQKVRQMQ